MGSQETWSCYAQRPSSKSLKDAEESGRRLRRALGSVQLTGIGIAVIIGTGIFVLTGEAAGTIAGPAVALSCVVAANRLLPGGALLRGVAATVPVAGSAYTFSYASLGELVAWIIGWDLMLELAFAAATVAIPGRSPVKAPPRSERRQLTAPKWWLI